MTETNASSNDRLSSQLCAAVSQACGEEPIGSAVPIELGLVIELPAPWPADAWQAPQVPAGVAALLSEPNPAGYQVRAQAVLPDGGYSKPGFSWVMRFLRPSGFMREYDKVALLVPEERVVEAAAALVKAEEVPAELARYRQDEAGERELLVCTHGSRDACCGSLGFPLYQQLRERYPTAEDGVRVWRTSHTGGHRFAPTMIDFPAGHYWGRLEPEILDSLLGRQGTVSRLLDHYRGWSALDKLAQVAERAAWLDSGWDWLGYHKAIQAAEAADTAEIRIDYRAADSGVAGSYRVGVAPRGTVRTLLSSGQDKWREETLYEARILARNGSA